MLIYAYWRGLGNRPARGTLAACSGAGDCGGQVQSETCRGLVAEGRMGTRYRGLARNRAQLLTLLTLANLFLVRQRLTA